MLLKVHVEEVLKHPANKTATICRSSLEFNDSVKFPFENIIQSFKTLYPNKQLVINFTVL